MSADTAPDCGNACDISDSDIYQAMDEVSGYVDITPEDFRELYRHAYRHAHRTISRAAEAGAAALPAAATESPGQSLLAYLKKMKGAAEHSPPRVGLAEICWSWVGAFLGIGLVAYCNFHLIDRSDLVLLIASFGASAVLIYGAVKSPLAQPRNFVGGHVVSALVGVACHQCFPASPWLASALAVATALAAMHATKTLHPPGGATALIAVIGGERIQALGFFYALVPVGLGALLMLAVALVVDNIPKSRAYPEYWW